MVPLGRPLLSRAPPAGLPVGGLPPLRFGSGLETYKPLAPRALLLASLLIPFAEQPLK